MSVGVFEDKKIKLESLTRRVNISGRTHGRTGQNHYASGHTMLAGGIKNLG